MKPCLHSVSYAGVWRGQATLSVEEFLVKAKKLGYDSVMLMAKRPHVSPLDYDDAARARLRARLKELGLTLVCLAGYTDFTAGVDKPGAPHVEIQSLYVGELAQMARDVGTSMVRIFTGFVRSGANYDRDYAIVVEGLRLSGQRAAEYGITLAVQNHHDIASHADAMYWLLKEVNLPNVKAAWDAWAPTVQGYSPEQIRQATLKMKPYIVHTTTADYVRLPQYQYNIARVMYEKADDVLWAVPMGQGIVDYKSFLTTLKEIGYNGYVGYEMCAVLDGGGTVENLDKTALTNLQYMKQF